VRRQTTTHVVAGLTAATSSVSSFSALRQQRPIDDALLKHLSPLGWEHISRAIMSGVRAGVWKAANLDFSDLFPFLNVRFFPFRDVKRSTGFLTRILAATHYDQNSGEQCPG
jgi:hypothetical protein